MVPHLSRQLAECIGIPFFNRIRTVEGGGLFEEWTLFCVYICEIS